MLLPMTDLLHNLIIMIFLQYSEQHFLTLLRGTSIHLTHRVLMITEIRALLLALPPDRKEVFL